MTSMIFDHTKEHIYVASKDKNSLIRYSIHNHLHRESYLKISSNVKYNVCIGADNYIVKMILKGKNILTLDVQGNIKEFGFYWPNFKDKKRSFKVNFFETDESDEFNKIRGNAAAINDANNGALGMELTKSEKGIIVWNSRMFVKLDLNTKEEIWRRSFRQHNITAVTFWNYNLTGFIIVGYNDGYMEQYNAFSGEVFYVHGEITNKHRPIKQIVRLPNNAIVVFDVYLGMYYIDPNYKLDKSMNRKILDGEIVDYGTPVDVKLTADNEKLIIVSTNSIICYDVKHMQKTSGEFGKCFLLCLVPPSFSSPSISYTSHFR